MDSKAINWLALADAHALLSDADYQHLANDSSLTRRVRERCRGVFSVRLIEQETYPPDQVVSDLLALPARTPLLSRQVFLCCDNQPKIFAKTLIGLTEKNQLLTSRLAGLGENSLGSILFRDPQAIKKQMHLAQISPRHDFFTHAQLSTAKSAEPVWVRRSLYRYDGCDLVVFEAFINFPAVSQDSLIPKPDKVGANGRG